MSQLLQLGDLLAARWEDSHWFLFDGSYTPVIGDTSSTVLTHQVTWPGIDNPTVSGWGTPSIGADSYAVSVGPPIGWTFNAAAGTKVVGGAFALDASGNFLGAELIPTGSVTLAVTGQFLPLTPQVGLSTIYP